jgi:hypothetical protein
VACILGPEGLIEGDIFLEWELTVEVAPIKAGVSFAPIFEGEMKFPPTVINDGLGFLNSDGELLFPDFTRIAVTNARARVEARGVRTEKEAILEPVDKAKTCTFDIAGNAGLSATNFPECEDDGDCPGASNSCLPFYPFAVTDDCDVCDTLGPSAAVSCEKRGFCAEGGVTIALGRDSGVYLADGPGTVFFGWADDLPTIETGIDRGAFELRAHVRNDSGNVMLSGLDSGLGTPPFSVSIFWECVMGVLSRGPDGPPTAHALASPAPSGMLISCPIQDP